MNNHAEHTLEMALTRAETLVRAGRIPEAVRALEVAITAADFIERYPVASAPPLRLVPTSDRTSDN